LRGSSLTSYSFSKSLCTSTQNQLKKKSTINSTTTVQRTLPELPSLKALNKKKVSATDINKSYDKNRLDYLPLRKNLKEPRRLDIGPYASANFLNYDLIWFQIHEMLFIEKGGDKQIPEELEAYNPLIPQGKDLTFTFMLQYPDAKRRTEFLSKLGHIENTIYISFENHKIYAENASNCHQFTKRGQR